MRNLYRLVFLLTVVSACSSPMNNRVHDAGGEDKTNMELKYFASMGYEVEIKWVAGPFGSLQQENHLLVLLFKDGVLTSLPDGQSLEFYATMPSMGHPMEDAGFFTEVDPGIFVNKNIRYNMPGDWKNELWIMDSEWNILDRLEWDELF